MGSSGSVHGEATLSSVNDAYDVDPCCSSKHMSPSPSVVEERGVEDSGGGCTTSAIGHRLNNPSLILVALSFTSRISSEVCYIYIKCDAHSSLSRPAAIRFFCILMLLSRFLCESYQCQLGFESWPTDLFR